jgi:hypothetical protein
MFCDMRISSNMLFVKNNMAAWLQLTDRLLAMEHRLCVTCSGYEHGVFIGHIVYRTFYVMSGTYRIYVYYVGHFTLDIFMLYRTRIISDVCDIRYIYQAYFCCIEHMHWIYLYYTWHISDISMLYRTYSCCIGHIYVVSDTFYLIYLLYREYSYYDGPVFLSDMFMLYRTHLCCMGHILHRTYLCYIWHTFYWTYLCYIGQPFYRTYLCFIGHIYWTHISDIFMCCNGLHKILY